MAKLKVFLSSTCYDLGMLRGHLRNFIENMGYEPVMSEYGDILFDPKKHTHDSCIREIKNCDMCILIIGSRYGGEALPESVKKLDFDKIKELSESTNIFEFEKLSITQSEVLGAISNNIPIYTFVDLGVSNDHLFYEKNKLKEGFLGAVEFPNIEKQETAPYIFEFINYLRKMKTNNAYKTFNKIEDIESELKKQWSGLFHEILTERKESTQESAYMKSISDQLKDIQATLMSTITNEDIKIVAKGVKNFRKVLEFIYSLDPDNYENIIYSNISWENLLKKCGIVDVKWIESLTFFTFLVKKDETFYRVELPRLGLLSLSEDWKNFKTLKKEIKEAIVDSSTFEKRNTRLVKYITLAPFSDLEAQYSKKPERKFSDDFVSRLSYEYTPQE